MKENKNKVKEENNNLKKEVELCSENLNKVSGGIIDDNFKTTNDTFYGPSEIKEE